MTSWSGAVCLLILVGIDDRFAYIVTVRMPRSSATNLDFFSQVDFDQILTNPILDIAARFWDKDRYEAFRVCYRSMRVIDDLIDDRKSTGQQLSLAEIESYRQEMLDWLEEVKAGSSANPFLLEFQKTVERFAIPLWPWERLVRAMSFDLSHDGFRSFTEFLRYSEGAAIAPASVFMHLCGVDKSARGSFGPPKFDIRRAARPLAIFSYLVHIIRDFQKDQSDHLNYFPGQLLDGFGLETNDLREIALSGRPTPPFLELIAFYRRAAEYYRIRARKVVDGLSNLLESQYVLSLEVIYGLYHQIFERIDPEARDFTTTAMNPTPEQVKGRLEEIVEQFQATSIS